MLFIAKISQHRRCTFSQNFVATLIPPPIYSQPNRKISVFFLTTSLIKTIDKGKINYSVYQKKLTNQHASTDKSTTHWDQRYCQAAGDQGAGAEGTYF